MKLLIKSLLALCIFSLLIQYSYPQVGNPNWVWGVTIDRTSNLSATVNALSHFYKKPTARIVFDEWEPADEYIYPTQQIHSVSNVMGEILDSDPFHEYTVQEYRERVIEYMDSPLQDYVDIWEIGNEINGEWLGEIPEVVAKIEAAYEEAKLIRNRPIAITFYYNYDCWLYQEEEMFFWIDNFLPEYMKNNIDYVWISYYEDNCNGYQPNWSNVFEEMHNRFPNSILGIGECGTNKMNRRNEYIQRYYSFPFIPDYIPPYVQGGVFWWYFKRDCVPYLNNPRWNIINNIMIGSGDYQKSNGSNFNNYPNPFNPSTLIKYFVPKTSLVTLKIYDILGREIKTLINGIQGTGEHSVNFDGTNLSSGTYLCEIIIGSQRTIKKMVLLK